MYFSAGIIVFLIAYSAGASVKLSINEANSLKQQFNKEIRGIDQSRIFLNNVRLCLGMFIPAIGAAVGIFSAFSTGMIFSAIMETSHTLNNNIPPQLVFITPFGILELFAYGMAISRSGILVYYLVKRRGAWLEYIVPTFIEIGLAALILLAASIIEWNMVQYMNEVRRIR